MQQRPRTELNETLFHLIVGRYHFWRGRVPARGHIKLLHVLALRLDQRQFHRRPAPRGLSMLLLEWLLRCARHPDWKRPKIPENAPRPEKRLVLRVVLLGRRRRERVHVPCRPV